MSKLGGEYRMKKFTEDYTVTVIITSELRVRMAIAKFLFRLGAKVLGAKFVVNESLEDK